MADTTRFIEVIAHSKVVRHVESYQTEIEIVVSNRKKNQHSCLEDSLKLRDEVIAALRKAGITEENIQEGGGDRSWFYNTDWKSVSHQLKASHADISILIKAMAKVEKIYTTTKQSFFSPIKKSLSLSAPQPKFSIKDNVVDHSLKMVITEAKEKASILASEAGLKLSGVLTIIEEPQSNSVKSRSAGEMLSDVVDDEMLSTEMGENYTMVSPQRRSTSRRFRVRFTVNDGEASEFN